MKLSESKTTKKAFTYKIAEGERGLWKAYAWL